MPCHTTDAVQYNADPEAAVGMGEVGEELKWTNDCGSFIVLLNNSERIV